MNIDKKSPYAKFVFISMELLVLAVFGFIIGRYIDQKYNLNGLGIGGSILILFILWLIRLVVSLSQLNSESNH